MRWTLAIPSCRGVGEFVLLPDTVGWVDDKKLHEWDLPVLETHNLVTYPVSMVRGGHRDKQGNREKGLNR